MSSLWSRVTNPCIGTSGYAEYVGQTAENWARVLQPEGPRGHTEEGARAKGLPGRKL